jgi:hypothetical protein
MICVKDPSYLLDGLSDDEVRVHGRLHDKSSCGALEHHRIKIADLLDGLGLDSYVWCSLAAFAFDYEGARRLARLINAERQVWSNKLRARFNAPLNDEIMLGVLGRRSGVSFFWYPERSYQDQTMSFRWSNTFTFVHPAPMRNREALRVVAGVLSRRKRAGFSLEPTLYWLSEIFSRRALLAGRSRRQASVIRRLVRWRLEQVAEMV